MVRINLSLATIFTVALMAAVAFSSSLSAATKATIAVDYGKLPLIFEANQGQTDERVKFLSRGRGYSLFLTESEAVLSLREADDKSHALRVKLLGAEAEPKMTGLDQLPGVSNYFIGNDPKKWRTKVPHYAKVGYEGVYPGIDLIFYGTKQRQLEYDFVVAPGADPSSIMLGFEGAETLEIDESGDLIARLSSGEVRFLKPVVYQMKDGTRQRVVGDYVLTDDRISFALGAYDPTEPLVIDPVLAYSTYLGGSAKDIGRDVAVDADGSAYVAGETLSVDFTASFDGPVGGDEQVFVAKVTPDGGAFDYITYLGGASIDRNPKIAVDIDGRAYIIGSTNSADFPTTLGALQPDYGGEYTSFVALLSAAGDVLEYATFIEEGYAKSIALRPGCPDPNQLEYRCKIYIAGYSNKTTLTTTEGAFRTTLAGGGKVVLVVIDPGGYGANDLQYSTYIGFGRSLGIAVDTSGDAYITGGTSSEDFPTSPTAYDQGCGDDADPNDCNTNIVTPTGGTIYAPFQDAFVVKISPLGLGEADLIYGTYLGGTGKDSERYGAIAVDTLGFAYVTGNTQSSDFPTTVRAFKFASKGGDAFVAKLNQDGSDLVYSTYLGGRYGGEDPHDIALRPGCPEDSNTRCSVYVSGETTSTDFPTTGGAIQTELGWHSDAFVTLVNADGSDLLYSTYLGGSTCNEGPNGSCSGSGEPGLGLAVDPAGNAVVVGYTVSDDFPVTANAWDTHCGDDFVVGDCTENRKADAFVAKFEDLSASNPNSIHVGNVDLIELLTGKKAWGALLAVTLHFPDEAIAGEVMVTGRWRGDSGYDHSAACALPSSGVCEIASGEISNRNESVTFTVETSDLAGFLFDPSANHDPDPDSNGTTITFSKPGKSSGGGGGGDDGGSGGGKPCNPNKPNCN